MNKQCDVVKSGWLAADRNLNAFGNFSFQSAFRQISLPISLSDGCRLAMQFYHKHIKMCMAYLHFVQSNRPDYSAKGSIKAEFKCSRARTKGAFVAPLLFCVNARSDGDISFILAIKFTITLSHAKSRTEKDASITH